MKVLVSAYACEPGLGSEQGVGWNHVRQAARFHDVWVLTQEGRRQEIEAALAIESLPRVRFVYFDLPLWALFWKKWPWGWEVHYYLWQLAAYLLSRRLHREIGFDVVNHVTFARYWTPCFLALLPIPLIWGPVGGGESAPRAFWWSFSLRGKILEFARDLARKTGEHDPFVRRTARKAALGLATTEETANRMRALGCRRVFVLSQVGLTQEEIRRSSAIPQSHHSLFRLVSVGNLLHWKGFELGLRAFAQFKLRFPASEYWIIGDGPERKRLQGLAESLGVSRSVTFWGTIPRQQVLQRLGDCDTLVHPSLHESGGYVCAEAMAAGRPVICLNLGGPALQVTEEAGIKVHGLSPDEAVNGLAQAFIRLAADSALRVKMGNAGQQRVKDCFDWNEKGQLMAKIYEDVVLKGQGDPDDSQMATLLSSSRRQVPS